MAFILNSESTMACEHGGRVQHRSLVRTGFRVAGLPPMRLTDDYIVVGCPHTRKKGKEIVPSPCTKVQWTAQSVWLAVQGSSVLTNNSVGICLSSGGRVQGTVIMLSFQKLDVEPDTPMRINY